MKHDIYSITKWVFWGLTLALTGCSSVLHKPANQSSSQNLHQIRSRYAQVNKGQIEYYRYGSGKPIVMITGYATDVSSWDQTFLNALARHNQLIIFNNRNVGGSVINSTLYSSNDLADDTYQLIQQLHLRKPAVLGISMGGMIAQEVAITHPDAVSKLILINTRLAAG